MDDLDGRHCSTRTAESGSAPDLRVVDVTTISSGQEDGFQRLVARLESMMFEPRNHGVSILQEIERGNGS